MSESLSAGRPDGGGPAGPRDQRGVRAAILWGGLTAGVLDILDAFTVAWLASGVPPVRVLQAIASGLLGREAFQGGLQTAALGLGLHFFIACTAAAVYVAASRRLPVLNRRWVACGLGFGVAVFFFMRHVVLPLSAFRSGPTRPLMLLNGLLIHAFGVGLPIAYFARRASRSPARVTVP